MSHKHSLPIVARSFWTPIMALDRLNSWLRSPGYWCPAKSALKSTIYTTKIAAILAISRQQVIGLRRVAVTKPCRPCCGTGRFHGWWSDYEDDGEPCRRCDATGTVTLRFIETTIGPVRWHTPVEKWWSWSLDVYMPYQSYYLEKSGYHMFEPTDWQPAQPGRPMPLTNVRRDMLIVLEAWPHDVCTSLDYQHHSGLEHTYRCPDVSKARAFINKIINDAEAYTAARTAQ